VLTTLGDSAVVVYDMAEWVRQQATLSDASQRGRTQPASGASPVIIILNHNIVTQIILLSSVD